MSGFFTYTLVLTNGVPWPVALGIGFWAGVLFLTGAREKLVEANPPAIVTAIPVGIGMFLLLLLFRPRQISLVMYIIMALLLVSLLL